MPRNVDLAIIGGGPAGLAAGLYAARARMDVVLLEQLGPGGQVLLTDWVDNYPGFPEGLSGFDLVERMQAQARRFGLIVESAEVRRLRFGRPHTLELAAGHIEARAVIIATGARPTRLGVPGEEELIGKGVSFCATCDGPFYRGEVVAVVGGGDGAVGEADYLTRFASKVYVIHRRHALRAAAVEQERLLANDRAEVIWDSVVESIEGQGRVEALNLRHVLTGEHRRLPVTGVFIYVGLTPTLPFLAPEELAPEELELQKLETDPRGFLVTDTEMRTRQPGVFAAGDCRAKALRQIVNAVGEGAVAVYSAQEYIKEYPGSL